MKEIDNIAYKTIKSSHSAPICTYYYSAATAELSDTLAFFLWEVARKKNSQMLSEQIFIMGRNH